MFYRGSLEVGSRARDFFIYALGIKEHKENVVVDLLTDQMRLQRIVATGEKTTWTLDGCDIWMTYKALGVADLAVFVVQLPTTGETMENFSGLVQVSEEEPPSQGAIVYQTGYNTEALVHQYGDHLPAIVDAIRQI